MVEYKQPKILIDKKIISVYTTKAPSIFDGTGSDRKEIARDNALSISYEIILKNCSSHKITQLSITDSLWGIGLTGTKEYTISVNVNSCCNNIIPNENENIVSSCGQLIIPQKSYLNPHSSSTIIVNIGIVNNESYETEIPLLSNTIVVTGNIYGSNISIDPIYVESREYINSNIYSGLGQSTGLGGPLCNYRLCFPYTNTRCNRTTCGS